MDIHSQGMHASIYVVVKLPYHMVHCGQRNTGSFWVLGSSVTVCAKFCKYKTLDVTVVYIICRNFLYLRTVQIIPFIVATICDPVSSHTKLYTYFAAISTCEVG